MIIDIGDFSCTRKEVRPARCIRKGRDRVWDTLHDTSPVRGAIEVFDLGWYIY